MQSLSAKRSQRLQGIRQSLMTNPVLKTNTSAIAEKVQKRRKRRESVVLDDNLTESQKNILLEEDDISTTAMNKFHEKYSLGQNIGAGSNGLVRKCYLKATGEVFAVKSMRMDQQHILFLKNNFKEIHSLDHANIVKYRTMYLDLKNQMCYLVMDYQTYPNLLEITDLSEDQIKIIIHQLLDTVSYIHSQNICHRDIKPQNILFNREDQQIKLIDFGISKNIQKRGHRKQMLTITGTLYYRAPQMFSGGGYDQKVDVWAVGVTLYQLITGKTPFQSEYLSTTIQNIQKGEICFEGEVWEKFGKALKDLISRLLKKRQQRLTAAEAKKHFWFNKKCSNPIDLTKSDSLDMKIISLCCKKYLEDSDKSLTNKIPHLSLDIPQIDLIIEDSDDSVIEVEPLQNKILSSICNVPKTSILKQGPRLKMQQSI